MTMIDLTVVGVAVNDDREVEAAPAEKDPGQGDLGPDRGTAGRSQGGGRGPDPGLVAPDQGHTNDPGDLGRGQDQGQGATEVGQGVKNVRSRVEALGPGLSQSVAVEVLRMGQPRITMWTLEVTMTNF